MQFLDGIVLKSAELLDVCVNTEKAATLDNPGALLSFFFYSNAVWFCIEYPIVFFQYNLGCGFVLVCGIAHRSD